MSLALLLAPVLALMAWYARSAYWQCDDAYISFRYVWHLVHGNGLVFNAGERVEGYTNFLWVLELAALWKAIGIAPEVACDALGALCTIGALVCVLGFARGGPLPERRAFAAFGALLLLATSRTWAVWTTSGLETRQFTFFALLGLLLTSRGLGRPGRLAGASLAFAGAEYTRPEGLLLWGCAGAWLLAETAFARRFSWRPLLAYGLPFLVLVAAHYLGRHAYYGDWLPNTYYAKHVRAWPEAGIRYLVAGAIETGAWLLLPFAAAGAVSRARRADRTHCLSAWVVGVHAAYLVRIGGDHFELRPLDFYWPLLAVAAAEGMLAVAAWIQDRVRALGPRRAPSFQLPIACALLAVTVVYGSAVQIAKARYTERFDTREKSQFLRVKLDPGNTPWLFALPGMSALIGVYGAMQDYTLRHGVGTVWREHEVFWRDQMRNWKPYAAVRGRSLWPSDAVTAGTSIGVPGYYLADLELIDLKGLTDRHVARQPARANEDRFMAHDRVAEPGYLLSRGFNLLIQPAARDGREALRAAPFALRLADDLWLPFSSRTPDWVETAFSGRGLWRWTTARKLGCFEEGAGEGWTFEGDAFLGRVRTDLVPTRTLVWPARCSSRAGLSSRDASGQGRGRGVVRSPTFRVPPDAGLELRLAGRGAGVRLVDRSGAVLAERTAQDADRLQPAHVDLAPYAGRDLALDVYDDADDAWVAVAGVVVLQARPLETDSGSLGVGPWTEASRSFAAKGATAAPKRDATGGSAAQARLVAAGVVAVGLREPGLPADRAAAALEAHLHLPLEAE